ncbi:MAG: hypothetical protein MI757_16010, partial [Pirellulales bacterium]|nr:hypothetical protein [Pirellulales bacterium]
MIRIKLIALGAILALPIAPPTANASDAASELKAKEAADLLVRAGELFKSGKLKESAAEIARCQAITQQLLNQHGTEKGRELIRPFAGRLKKAHALLELQGYSLPPLKFTADSSADPKPVEQADDTPHFVRDVAPILISRCGRCHIEKSEGELSFNSYASIMAGADGQPVIEPGDADGSSLVELMRSGDMPAN